LSEIQYPAHGTRARYAGSKARPGCRCEPCVIANREYGRAYRRRRGVPVRPESFVENQKPKPVDGHCPISGRCSIASRSQYTFGCRDDPCKAENRDYMRGWNDIW